MGSMRQILQGIMQLADLQPDTIFDKAGGVMLTSCKRQQTVALLTTEAEYYGLTNGITKLSGFDSCLENCFIKTRISRQSGSTGTTRVRSHLQEFYGSSAIKARRRQHHFIPEHVAEGKIDIWYIPTANTVADGLTKG